jgi:hypothetical protein
VVQRIRVTGGLTLLALGLALGACAQTLAPLTQLDKAHFQLGVTRKGEVANVLGLPRSRSEDADYEYWNYAEGPALSSVDVPVVLAVSGPVVTTTMESVPVDEKQETAVVYVFRHDGVLFSVRDVRGAQ